ncbi:4383_t:CDS:2, partial [Racocetra persica]
NKNNNYLTAEYLTTRRAYDETKKAYIERISQNKIINFIPWNEIDEKIEFVDAGGSGIITKAKWIKENITVALKTVAVSEETDSDNDEFIKEQIKAFHNIGLVLSSKTNEENKEKTSHIGYENYAELGCLRNFLIKNTTNWEQKVNIARQITCGLYFLHTNEILHRDLHTKNVVIKKDGDGVRAIITDFGLSKVLPRNSKSNQRIGGCAPFVAPEVLNNIAAYDYKSDIYSLGVVLWEITSNGRPPFEKVESNLKIAIQTMKGIREQPINESTDSYVKLYTNCWDGDPKLRPEINQVYESIRQEDIISGEEWKDLPQSCDSSQSNDSSKSSDLSQSS